MCKAGMDECGNEHGSAFRATQPPEQKIERGFFYVCERAARVGQKRPLGGNAGLMQVW